MDFKTDASGKLIASAVPKPAPPPTQKITGSIAQAAAEKTTQDAANQAAAFKALGAGQKGSSRRKRRHTGGAGQNVTPSNLPTANSVPGANPTDVMKKLVDIQTQLKASGTYDKLINAPPAKVGGFRMYGAEDLYPGSGTHSDTKDRRKTKKKHGRRHKRTHRGKRSKSRHLRRRSRRAV
jgi:hypothetical protein